MKQTIEQRQAIERQIVECFIDEMLAQGHRVAIDNGGDDIEFPPTNDASKVKAEIMATDDERIYVYRNADKPIGHAYFVYGNSGWDVLCDYTVNLENLMPKTLALGESLEPKD